MNRLLKRSLLAVLALILVLLIALAGLLGTQSGSRWLLGRVPGLQVENYSGRLAGRWQADALRWQQDSTIVDIKNPQFEWSPGCLLRMTLCIDQLKAQAITLQLPASTDEPSSGPITLPELNLPLAVELGEIEIGSLQLNGVEQLQGLQLAAHWTAEGLKIDKLAVQREDLNVALTGLLKPTGDWPLTVAGDINLPSPDGGPWKLALTINGDLQNTLNIDAQSSGYLPGHLTGELQALAENLPAKVQLTADGFKGSEALPETLRLNQVLLTAEGDLKQGYTLNGNAQLPGEGGDITLLLKGLVTGEGADISQLQLSADEQRKLDLNAKMSWTDGFSVDASYDWHDFPWLMLYPLESPPPVSVKTLKGDISFANGNYLGNIDASLSGPAGAFTVKTPVSGDLTQVHLPDLQVVAGQGKAQGRVQVGFADGISWDTQLQLTDLDPAYWVAEMPGTLAGPLASKGQLKNEILSLNAALDINGKLRGQTAQLKVDAAGAGQSWTLSALNIKLGENSISGDGTLDKTLAGQLRLNLPRLGQLWPELQGRVTGRVDLTGSLNAPQGKLTLKGQQIAYIDQRINSLDLNADLNSAQQADIKLMAEGIALGDTQLGRLDAAAQGNRQRQSLKLDLKGPLLETSTALQGVLNDKGTWRGTLDQGQIKSGGQDWRLQQPATLERLASGQITLGKHCWRSGSASLCGEDQRLLPDPRIRYQLKGFPLESLAKWFPKDFAWQGKLDAAIKLDIPSAGPSGQITVDAGRGSWRVRNAGEWNDFNYDNLRLVSDLKPTQIVSTLQLSGPKLGQINVQAKLDPRPGKRPISGTYNLQGVDISIARPFVRMVDTLTGRLSGNGTLSGTLLAPLVNGRVQLADTEISGGQLPTNFERLQVLALINGQNLQLTGDWRSGEKGTGQLKGNLAWGDGLAGQLNISAKQMSVNVEPYAALEVEPDITIVVANEQMSVRGKVLVPRGSIEVRELPPSTVQVSSDARIVGSQAPDDKPVAIAMDVDVIVGDDLLKFSGFGLKAEIAGNVHIGNDLDTRGVLNLNNGKFAAYGQKLTIRRARLLFAGPIDQPYLDVEAIRTVGDVVAGLRLTGNAAEPKSEVFSEPAMSQNQALSYLILGRPIGDSGDSNLIGQAVVALSLKGGTPFAGNVAQTLGIKDFQLDSEGSGDSTSVVASGKLSERLSLRYGVGVFEPVNTVALRYELTKRLYLEAASGLASSLDIFFKRDF
ncbi:translocation/assembly module TamB domain-containing protein [Pseudomonas sp. EL_65y_Pfl2_R95]|uniref:translocation/assembly module TamB domain-containing protein n=1 Tax=Pseudomonas sp. EL_65y_Pfl2_R95 TaxID=3088698 RepID=UPI0030DDC9F7